MRQSYVLDEAANRLVPAAEYWARKAAETADVRQGSPVVIGDLRPDEATISPVDGSLLTSRRDIRAHNARNGVEDVGNEFRRPQRPVPEATPYAETIAGVLNDQIPVSREPLPTAIVPED